MTLTVGADQFADYTVYRFNARKDF